MNTIRLNARLALLVLVLCAGAALPASAQDVGDWAYQMPVSVTNPGATLTDYQVKIVLNGTNFDFTLAEPDGADLLFTDVDGEVFYPYWIETWDAGAQQAVVWVRVPELPAGDTSVVAMLMGNPAAEPRSDGAATFLFYSGFEELAGQTGMNAPAPLVTPTYDGSGQVVHPDVIHVPGGWNGYEYWMAMTPYPNSNDNYENPSVLVSNDNLTWVVPPGVTNPLEPEPNGHNDDTDILLVGGEMIIYYNETNNNGNTYIKRLASTDGVFWSDAVTVITLPNYVMSPAVIHDGSLYHMWYVRSAGGCSAPSQAFYHRTSLDGIAWGPEEAATMDHPGRVLWHFDVQLNAGLYTMLLISYPNGSSCGNTTMYYAESTDGLTWTADPGPFLARSSSGWDNGNMYRASFSIDGAFLRVWYSAMSSGGQWRVGYTEGDLDEFIQAPANTWSQLVGNVAATTDHPRSGTHGLREIGGSTYPQVFAPLSGGNVCVNVWYWEAMSTTTNFMALLRLWDSATVPFPAHCIGTGIWVGRSTTNYSYHTEGFVYTASTRPRSPGWRHLSIAVGSGPAQLRVDGNLVATLSALNPALINRFSVEGYLGGTGFFDDAYVRRYVENEPEVFVGDIGVVGIDDRPDGSPEVPSPAAFAVLEQNVPNPLNPETRIAFSLPHGGPVTLQILDLRGQVVRTLVDGVRSSGRHEVVWNGRDDHGALAASGTYLYRLTTPEQVLGRKLMLVK
ncbi:MAG: DUF2341 domain-containing protein [Krumholzibacteria bacterium]|nr:DUF2341 domain-containing protein [Candidatus Krumholzibacteria bacterium]